MKFSGEIGFWEGDIETSPSVWEPSIVERHYTGDILRNNRRFQSGDNQKNDNLVISNQVSILADLYALKAIQSIRYVKWMGVCWKVNSVEINHPRLTLELGDVYNGVTAEGVDDQNGEI